MEMTVTNGAWEYLLITDVALVTVEWKSSTDDRRQVFELGLGEAGSLLSSGDANPDFLDGSGSVLGLGQRRGPPLARITDVHYCTAASAPSELSSHPRWPRVAGGQSVEIVPRSVLGSVKLRWWGSFRISFRGTRPVKRGGINFWHVGRARQHLTRAGYLLV